MNRLFNSIVIPLIVLMLLIISCSSDSKSLTVAPSAIDFEDVYIGEFTEMDVTLKNKFGKDLVIKSVNINGSPDFTISSIGAIPANLLPNQEMTFTIKFEPSTSGLIEASLSILHGIDDKEKILPISGVGIACARIDLSENSYDFLKKTINKVYTHDFEISNIGTDDLDISNLTFTGTGATAFKVTPTSISIVAGSKETFTITFEPTGLIKYDAELMIVHNGVNENTPISYTVSGEGRNTNPQITLSQTSPWDFRRVPIAKSKTSVCEIENTGIDPLKITSVTLQTSVEFIIDAIKDSNDQPINLPYDISVGDKITIEIKFTPGSLNTFNDTLSIVHDGTNESSPLDISLIGEGSVQEGLDFNGDGYADVIVGARGDDDGGLDSGCAFIFFGSATPSNNIDASAADVKIVGGDPGDQLNFVSSAGDFNDDGYDDIIIGAIYDDDGGTDSGCAFIFYGSANPASTIDASTANVKFVGGDPGDKFGIRVSSIGDFNNDGIEDVMIGAYQDDDGGLDSGCAFIFFGSKTPPSTIDASAADIKFVGGDPGDRFGVKANYAGDFNNDGIDDVIIGADCDDDGGTDSGCAFIYFGCSNPLSLYDATAADVKLVGADPDDRFAYSLSLAGDFNNDGYDDIIVGANQDDDAGISSGSAFIFFGSATPAKTIDASVANVKITGEMSNDRFGINVSSIGDFNNDGYDDVISASSYKDVNGTDSGVGYVFFGSATPSGLINASNADIKLIGTNAGDMFAHNNASAGDFNNDGYNDLVIGAYGDDDGGSDSGCAFIFFGKTNPASSINATSADVKLVGADSGDRFFTLSSY